MVDMRVFFLCLLVFSLLGGLSVAAETFSDPLRPLNYHPEKVKKQVAPPPVDTSGWTLSAVLSSASRTVALVNGQALKEGDYLQGFRLTSIKADRVVLRKGQREIVLTREGTGLRKKSATEGNGK